MLTVEQARSDLYDHRRGLVTLGPGSADDRAACMMLAHLEFVQSILSGEHGSNPTQFRRGAPILEGKNYPSLTQAIMAGYMDDEIEAEQAGIKIGEAIEQYRRVFTEMEIEPQKPTAIDNRTHGSLYR